MSIPDEIPQSSKEFLTVEFDSPDDLTLGTVKIGLSSTPLIPPVTWFSATWPTPGENVARTSAPVDFSTVAQGHYRVWAELVDSPEDVPRPYGTVRVI